jgi:hypothetical protein
MLEALGTMHTSLFEVEIQNALAGGLIALSYVILPVVVGIVRHWSSRWLLVIPNVTVSPTITKIHRAEAYGADPDGGVWGEQAIATEGTDW